MAVKVVSEKLHKSGDTSYTVKIFPDEKFSSIYKKMRELERKIAQKVKEQKSGT